MLEREIKLQFATAKAARDAVEATGAIRLHDRRLQRDFLLDTIDGRLREMAGVLRLRVEPGAAALTFKGPVQPGAMKLREEIESPVADGMATLAILERVGFRVWFRYEKYREEFAVRDVVLAVDETPVGTFLELEGAEGGIADLADMLGYGPADYLLDSYRSLFVKHCATRGIVATDMLFEMA